MGCWVLTDKYKEDLAEINCFAWDSDHFSKDNISAYIDFHYETMLNKPLKSEVIVINGYFNSLYDLYRFNNIIHKSNFPKIVVYNFHISHLIVTQLISFFNIRFIGTFEIANCEFKQELMIDNCIVSCQANIIGSYFFRDFYLNIEIGSNLIVFDGNCLGYWFDLPYSDMLQISNIMLIDANRKIINFNKFFKNISSKFIYFTYPRQKFNFIKNYFQQKNNYIDSNIFYALEMLSRSKELKKSNKYLQRFVFFINRITSNHGQSILLPTIWILCLAILCALAQWCDNRDGFYWLGVIFFPYFPEIDYKELHSDWKNQLLLFGYLTSKSLSAMLWWQLSRAIRKDIKR